jgi:putative flippase GtrA
LVDTLHKHSAFLRFCVVGGFGYMINLAGYTLALRAGCNYGVAATLAFVTAASSNYALNRRWTFGSRDARVWREYGRTIAAGVWIWSSNLLFLTALVSLGVEKVAAQAGVVALLAPASYVVNRTWCFRKTTAPLFP